MTTKLMAFHLTDDDGEITICNSIGEEITSHNLPELMRFLQFSQTGHDRGHNYTIRVVWDLDAWVAPILRKFDIQTLQMVANHDNNARYGGDTIFYRHGKLFRTRKAYYYPIQESFPSDTPAPSCVYELQERADNLVEGLEQLGMGDFKTIASLISIFGQTEFGQRVFAGIPRDYEIPRGLSGMLEYADQADRKEWITNYAIGCWEDAADWDLSAAYSGEAAKLLDLRDLEYWHSDTMTKREEGALFGFVKGRMFVDPDNPMQHTSPIMVNDGEFHGNPAGWLMPDCYSLSEVRFIEGSGLGEFIMEDGYFAKVMRNVRPRMPFEAVMKWFYDHRSVSPTCSTICKGMANQLVGKLAERLKWKLDANGEPEYGELFNIIYHSLITCATRVKVARWLLDNGVERDQLLCVQTDGARILKDIEPSKRNGMGSWVYKGKFDTLVASPNIILAAGKKPQHYTYNQLIPEIQANPLGVFYGMLSPAHITLQQALQLGDISKVGELRELPAHLDLPAVERQQNRQFADFPKNGRQLLEGKFTSKPVIL